ncbi:hypothetical protein ML603_08450 [Streptococcus dysgalactiae subsp. equisimilis]|uniref:hypothetical protein n=1 Tax=Streptococcus dysgalactiae TaxID=1334 RepID=UPI001F137FE3|nr:hypothetical protein [Streptococcus dysgalactiae]UMY67900.1 hypothetical protein ML603_08450 [Streptococcus dysgalactiae subsp. equisimilis]
MRPKRYPYQKNKLIIQSKNAKTKIELDSGKITINADAIVIKDDLTHDESYNSNIACFERMQQKLKSIYGTSEIISETIGQDKKPTETVDFRISRLESVVDEIEREIACIYGIIL